MSRKHVWALLTVGCSYREISEAGYHSIINADVAVGKPYPFSAEFSYDDHPAAPVEVVVRPFNGPVTAVLQPIVISSIPSQ